MNPSLISGGTELAQPASRRLPKPAVSWPPPRHGEHFAPAVHRVEWIGDPERFAELEEQWDWLAARERAPFARHAWFWAWWDAFGAGKELSICAVWRGRRLVAVLPLWRQGEALRAMANVHTPVFQVPACDHQARRSAFHAAFEAAPGALEIEALAATDSALPALARDSRGAGLLPLVESVHTSPIIDLQADFAAYRKLHPSRCRKLLKLGRKMLRDHDAEVALIEVPENLDAELDRAFELEAAGWKGVAGTAMASAEETKRFYRSVANAYQRFGELRLSTITLNGELAAFDVCLLNSNRLWTLKGSYNEQFSRLSPGNVLLLWEIERSCELGLRAVELLGDAEEYKLGFATSEREHRRFRAYARRPASVARFAYRRWARPMLKERYRQLPRQRPPTGEILQWSRPWPGRGPVPRRSTVA